MEKAVYEYQPCRPLTSSASTAVPLKSIFSITGKAIHPFNKLEREREREVYLLACVGSVLLYHCRIIQDSSTTAMLGPLKSVEGECTDIYNHNNNNHNHNHHNNNHHNNTNINNSPSPCVKAW